MTDHIIVEQPSAHPGVQLIRFNRPEKKNAITRAMYRTMADALNAANADANIRATAFLGTEGCFSAGNDLNDFLSAAIGGGGLGQEILDFLYALVNAEKPVVSGVDGLAIGIGTTIHLHCDLTIASNRSQFRTPFVDLALVPEAASSLIGPRIMGHQRAFAMLAAGEAFSAEEAREAGLVWKVADPGDVDALTLDIAARLAAKPPEALRIARELVRGPREEIIARIDEEARHFSARLKSAEARAAFEAFMRR
ncbi:MULTISPECIES: crotonase/enoyl-CoA hydratase family protein [Rhizobium]|uniref:Crotonase/enoyl-CoA hydratase family protein n=1 Tax=Rhizobium bangladeshense TaxID=1138189 RepID=A0ABS7LD41_9HYPH|nr:MULTISPECIES: crotonase/enoyl-CoA hydratase family protein [Rhizobium]MBX4875309.1 crotonase/enoyl-CoA hydratase family protein [Rhizobium bangladeshense]MBX4882057.1 crotonase/enoyl-CoA hydratase family protein [Rhizobium bangladeshense]MBX4892601.1 crotonase/enoyl-CoA hydratase family protein [Rhizobium bangladeshense]MBX4913831.1 crotonase/enoyl-CoA hydratase family protein [Rhizobium bangladeshense]MBX4919868.1 crotonase/enoyl-CoA hydratase family protein [Rhizobium bangladeshense]